MNELKTPMQELLDKVMVEVNYKLYWYKQFQTQFRNEPWSRTEYSNERIRTFKHPRTIKK